jgi:hypothetical protein
MHPGACLSSLITAWLSWFTWSAASLWLSCFVALLFVLVLLCCFAFVQHALKVCLAVSLVQEGQPLVLSAVRQAEQRLVADGSRNKEYQPM